MKVLHLIKEHSDHTYYLIQSSHFLSLKIEKSHMLNKEDIKYIEISTDKTKKLTILHDLDHSLDERIMKEQFLT